MYSPEAALRKVSSTPATRRLRLSKVSMLLIWLVGPFLVPLTCEQIEFIFKLERKENFNPYLCSFSTLSVPHDDPAFTISRHKRMRFPAHGHGCDGLVVALHDVEDAARIAGIQEVQVSRQGDADEVVLGPEASNLLVVHVIAHLVGAKARLGLDVPELASLVP